MVNCTEWSAIWYEVKPRINTQQTILSKRLILKFSLHVRIDVMRRTNYNFNL